MSLLRQLAGQTVIYGLGQILPRVFYFIVFTSYLTYRLSERSEYTIYVDLYAYVSVLLVIFSYRMDTAFFRFGKRAEDVEKVYQTALLPMLGTSIIVVLIGYLFAEPIATALTYPGRGYYVRWFSWIVALDVLALLPYAKLRLTDQPRRFVFYKILNVIITIVLVLFFLEGLPRFFPEVLAGPFAFAQSDVDLVFLSNLMASAFIFGLLLIKNMPTTRAVDWVLWRKMVAYSWPLIIVGVAGSINQFFGVPLQKYFLGDAIAENKDSAAVYGAVQKIPALLAMFTTAYNYAAEPFFFKNSEDKDAKILYGDIAQFFIVVAGFISIIMYGWIDIFGLLIGPAFREGLYLVPILLMAYLFLGIYYNVSIWYKLSDKTTFGAMIALVGAVITVGGSIALLPRLGVEASAWVALVCYTVMVILAMLLGRKYYPIAYPIIKMIRQLGIIVVLLFLIYLLHTDSIFQNLLVGTGVIILYGGISWTLEKDKLKSYLA